jgi:glycosyltransferase involved in cell wall biosynthesis
MRILQIVPHFYPAWSFGGIARVVYEISRELVRRGHEVTVHTTNVLDQRTNFGTSKPEYSIEGIRVRYYRNLGWFGGANFSSDIFQPSTRKEIQDADIINMHGYRTFQNAASHFYSERCHTPYVLTAHGTIPRIVEKIVFKKLYDEFFGYKILKHARSLIASANIEKKQYVDMGISDKKVAIIPNGINTESFTLLPMPGTFKSSYGISDDVAVVLYVGRVHKRKGIGFLLDAFARLGSANAVLVIAGPDDGYMSTMKEKASYLKIANKVIFTGFISERAKMAAYIDSVVVVYPGIYESFGLVPLEAALCSKPVIVSENNVMAEIVKQGKFGLSVKYGDAAHLIEILQKILDNPWTAKRMGKQGKQFVKENYNWSHIVSKLEAVYSNSIAGA